MVRKLSQIRVKVVSKYVKVVSNLCQSCIKVVQVMFQSCPTVILNLGPKFLPCFSNWCKSVFHAVFKWCPVVFNLSKVGPGVVHVDPKQCQVVSIYVTMC